MSRIDNLPGRRWDLIKDAWIAYIPSLDIETHYPDPTIWHDLAVSTLRDGRRDREVLAVLPTLRQSTFRDVVVQVRKFSYCRTASLIAVQKGLPTAATIMAYDAAYFGARAFLGLVGIVNVGRQSKIFVDLFKEREEKRRNGRVTLFDAHELHFLGNYLTHEMTWSVCERMRNSFRFAVSKEITTEEKALATRFREFDLSSVSNLRNNLIYDGGHWLSKNNYDHCDLIKLVGRTDLLRSVEGYSYEDSETLFYFRLVSFFGDFLTYLLKSLADLAPGLSGEVIALSCWSHGILRAN